MQAHTSILHLEKRIVRGHLMVYFVFNSFIGPNKNVANKPTATIIVPTITEDLTDDHETAATEKDKENIIVVEPQQQETHLPTMTESLPPTVIATATPLSACTATSTQMSQETDKSTQDKHQSASSDANQKKEEGPNKKATGPHTIEILSNELIDLNKTNTNAINEILQTKEVSPKKTNPTRFTPLVISNEKL